jgi:Flp pilus assembly protein TadG
MKRGDEGRVAIFFAIVTPALLALLGLVYVGGNRIIALQRANDIAVEAARAAGQAIDAPSAIAGDQKVVDPDAAAAAAQQYIVAAGAQPVAIEIAKDRRHLSIVVEVTYDPGAFGFFVGRWTARGEATATLVVT